MSTYIVKAKKTKLKAGLSVSAMSLTLDELVDSQGNPIVMASFGDWFVLVVKQADQTEMILCTGVTQNANGSATITVDPAGRNLAPIFPYAGSTTGYQFLAGSEVIVTNDPKTVMSFASLVNPNTWNSTQTFAVSPIVPEPTLGTHAVNKDFVTAIAIAGGVDASPTAKGISKLTAVPSTAMGNIGVLTSLGTATMTIATPAVVSLTAHGLVVNDIIQFTTSGTLPTGVSTNTNYYVISAGFGANSFQFSTTLGGSAVNTSGSQSGTHTLFKLATISIASPALVYLTAHGFTAGDTITLQTTGALPTGLSTATTYYVLASGLTANTFQLSLSSGGTAINTSGTQSGTHSVTRTTPYAVSNDDPRMLTSSEVAGVRGAFPSAPSSNNPVVTKDTIYTDGFVASQTVYDTDVAFGQNDATTKRVKIAQSFVNTKSNISSVTLRKGTLVAETTSTFSEATMSTPTYSESDTNANWSDSGVISSSYRRITASANYWYGADYARLTKVITTVAGEPHTLTVDIAGTFGTNGSATASMTCDILIDGVVMQSITSGSEGVFDTKTVNFTPNSSSATVVFSLHTYGGGYNQSAPFPRYFDFKNLSVTYPLQNSGDFTVKLYSDLNGNPSSTLLGTATILNGKFISLTPQADFTANFSSAISGLTIGATYWIVMESSSPSTLRYFALVKTTTNPYSSGVAKYNNTTDGWVSETGDLYFKINQNIGNSQVATNANGYLPVTLIPPSTTKFNLVGTPFGAGSASSVNAHIGYDATKAFPTYIWLLTSDVSANCYIYRYERQNNGNYLYKGTTATFAVTSGQVCGITEMNGSLYVSYNASGVMACRKYNLALTLYAQMTGGFVGQSLGTVGMVSDPTLPKIWCMHSSSLTDLGGYTVSGNTFTRTSTVTLSVAISNASNKLGIAPNGDFVSYEGLSTSATVIQRYNSSGTAQTSITASILTYLANAVIACGWLSFAGVNFTCIARKVNSEWTIEVNSIDL